MRVALLLFALCTGTSQAAEFHFPHLSVGGLVAFRSGSHVGSFVGAWTPFVSFENGYAVRADVGASLLKDSLGDLFIGTHAEVMGVIPLVQDTVNWEIGGGLVYWSGTSGGLNALASTGLNVPLKVGFLDRITATYSFHTVGAGVHWLRMTLGLRWSAFEGS